MEGSKIEPCGRLAGEWDWKSGSTFNDSTTTIPFQRNYFDCGTYFFDGAFNVVKFPKGMSIYHGSAILANLVLSFPVGIDYYKIHDLNNTSATTKIQPPPSEGLLGVAATVDENIEEIISRSFEISAGWFADPSVSRIYSSAGSNPALNKICQDKCIHAYKLKSDIVLFLLDDDYNISKLLHTPSEAIVPEKQKQNLRYMFQLKKDKPTRTNLDNPFIRLHYDKQRKSDRGYDLPFAKWACEKIVKPMNYSGYSATTQQTAQHAGQFHLEFIFCNAFDYLERDLSSPLDWQHPKIQTSNPTIQAYFQQLFLYQSVNVNFHAGDLFQHSVWSLLFSELILRGFDMPAEILGRDTFRKTIAFSSFVHDIGKMSPPHCEQNNKTNKFIYFSIEQHAQIGYEYIIGKRNLPVFDQQLNRVGEMTSDQLLTAFGIDLKYKRDIALAIKFHWELGSMLQKINNPGPEQNQIDEFAKKHKLLNQKQDDIRMDYYAIKYLNMILEEVQGISKPELLGIIYMVGVVSLADINASQPYGVERLTKLRPGQDLNKQSSFFPFISNVPKLYRGGNVAVVSNINIRGVHFVNVLLEKIKLEYNV